MERVNALIHRAEQPWSSGSPVESTIRLPDSEICRSKGCGVTREPSLGGLEGKWDPALSGGLLEGR
jgi:hypothetical protein